MFHGSHGIYRVGNACARLARLALPNWARYPCLMHESRIHENIDDILEPLPDRTMEFWRSYRRAECFYCSMRQPYLKAMAS